MREVMLTTVDNPFNPFEQWDEWFRYDLDKQHNTCGLLDRIAVTSDELSELEYQEALEVAIDEWVKLNPLTHAKVVKNN